MKDYMHQHRHGPWARGRGGFWWGHQYGPHGRGRQHGRGHRGGPGGNWEDFFSGMGSWFWGGRQGGFGGGRERLERGLLRYIILDVLKDGPKHGYEIIKQLEERTQGRYSPSPGTLYPTLQYLEDLGLVRSQQEEDKKTYSLTDSGHAELDKQHNTVENFWSRFQYHGPSGESMHELRFAGDTVKDLFRTLAGGLQSGVLMEDPEAVRKIRQVLERSQNEIREIIAQSASGRQTQGGENVARLDDDDLV
jgi:DNA-binding PadR family transcriptional regulator